MYTVAPTDSTGLLPVLRGETIPLAIADMLADPEIGHESVRAFFGSFLLGPVRDGTRSYWQPSSRRRAYKLLRRLVREGEVSTAWVAAHGAQAERRWASDLGLVERRVNPRDQRRAWYRLHVGFAWICHEEELNQRAILEDAVRFFSDLRDRRTRSRSRFGTAPSV